MITQSPAPQQTPRAQDGSPWSPREAELLAVTLQLLQVHGYDRLSVDEIANTAHASKATIYRRWPSKAELVLAAFIEGVAPVTVVPDSGTLRGDLLQVGRGGAPASPSAGECHSRGARRNIAQLGAR
jgi:AcrR family transcriptional regulator